MSGVSLETCWAIKKHWNNKFYYTVASCWLFIYDYTSIFLSTYQKNLSISKYICINCEGL